jgi:hypothetical protein
MGSPGGTAIVSDERLRDLVDRFTHGRYHPQPVRRVEIPKENGKTRPLGIPALEDKIQLAVKWLLEPIYGARCLSAFRMGFGRKRFGARRPMRWGTALQDGQLGADADHPAFFDPIDTRMEVKFVGNPPDWG